MSAPSDKEHLQQDFFYNCQEPSPLTDDTLTLVLAIIRVLRELVQLHCYYVEKILRIGPNLVEFYSRVNRSFDNHRHRVNAWHSSHRRYRYQL